MTGVAPALALAGASAILAGSVSPLVSRSPRAGLAAQSIGAVLLGVAGAWVLVSGHAVGAGFRGEARPAFGIDRLSGFFLLLIAVVGAPAALFARDALAADWQGRSLALVTGAFLLALVGVRVRPRREQLPRLLGADDAGAGGGDPASPARTGGPPRRVRVPGDHAPRRRRRLGRDARARPARRARPATRCTAAAWRALVAVAALVGFGTKAGLMPLHSWLPRAHPVAPAHVSALMSGVMIKVALYGLIRVQFQWLGAGAAVARARRCWRSARCRRSAACCGRWCSTSSSGCWRFTRSRTSASSRSGSARRCCSRDSGSRSVGAIAFAAALLHALNHARLQGAAVPRRRAVQQAPSGASSSIASAGCCGGCRGRAGRSRSARWRSPGCRR